jgi:hypothetical protein
MPHIASVKVWNLKLHFPSAAWHVCSQAAALADFTPTAQPYGKIGLHKKGR